MVQHCMNERRYCENDDTQGYRCSLYEYVRNRSPRVFRRRSSTVDCSIFFMNIKYRFKALVLLNSQHMTPPHKAISIYTMLVA